MKIAAIATQLAKDDHIESWKVACEAIKYIYNSYGKAANSPEFRSAIKASDEYTISLLDYLIEEKAFTYSNINYLLKHLTSTHNQKNAKVHIQVQQKFAQQVDKNRSNADIQDNEKIWITIQQDNKIYKRSLDTDLKKLLD